MSMVKVMKIDEWLEKKLIEKDAIIFKDQNWTFLHLIKLITKTSLFLQNECQLKVGDRFCYFGTNNPEQIALLFAASKIGAIMFPINWRLANPEIEYLIKHSNPNVIFFDTKFEEKISQIRIPRNIKRADKIKKEIKSYVHLTEQFQSKSIGSNTEIIIDNSIGQLEMWYKNVKTVFLGKSYPPKGGQNPIEPARNGCAIISGKMSNTKSSKLLCFSKSYIILSANWIRLRMLYFF